MLNILKIILISDNRYHKIINFTEKKNLYSYTKNTEKKKL